MKKVVQLHLTVRELKELHERILQSCKGIFNQEYVFKRKKKGKKWNTYMLIDLKNYAILWYSLDNVFLTS